MSLCVRYVDVAGQQIREPRAESQPVLFGQTGRERRLAHLLNRGLTEVRPPGDSAHLIRRYPTFGDAEVLEDGYEAGADGDVGSLSRRHDPGDRGGVAADAQ